MAIHLSKYWSDVVRPILRREPPPMVPQAVILDNRQVLLVKRDNPALWELPGGGILPGETPEAAIHREVYEETGISVEIITLLGWYQRTGFRAHCSPVYLCRPIQGRLRSHTDDVVNVRYFSLHDLPRGLFPWYRSILERDVLRSTPRPLQCTQHQGLWVVLECLALDVGSRLRLLD
jgi:8-oxo-dGTP pyrophosphatase MutT (NUDIX family)